MNNNKPKRKLSDGQYEHVISALAAHQPVSVIVQELAEQGTTFSPWSVYSIKRRNREHIVVAKEKNKERTVLDEKYARILSRERVIAKLEGSLAHAGSSTGVDRIAAQINNLLDSIAKELGVIQSGTRQTNITNVHQGPEKDYLAFHRDRLEERRKALGGE